MKTIIYVILVVLLGYVFHLFMPWWCIAIAAGLIGAIAPVSVYRSFAMGFLGAAVLWGVTALIINTQNDGTLATRMGALLGGVSPAILIIITALISGIVGGMGALTGTLGRHVFKSSSQ